MRYVLPLVACGVLAACPAVGQTAVFTVGVNAIHAEPFYEARATGAIRWRPCPVLALCVQVGAIAAVDNPHSEKMGGSVFTHFAVGADVGPFRGALAPVRLGASLSQFQQVQALGVLPFSYYRAIALSAEYRTPRFRAIVEPQVYQFDLAAVGTPIHDWRIVVDYAVLKLDVHHTRAGAGQASYSFWSPSLLVAYEFVFVEAGWRSVPSLTENRNVNMGVVTVGFRWTNRGAPRYARP
jgi:hypothetical protein